LAPWRPGCEESASSSSSSASPNFLIAVVIVPTIYRAKLPQKYVDAVVAKASEATRTDVHTELSKLPADTHLWGIATATAINGLLYLLIGVWTQSAYRHQR
jgi:hypothetical protein